MSLDGCGGAPALASSTRVLQNPAMSDLSLAADFPFATETDWLKLVRETLKGASFESLVTKTRDGIAIRPLEARAANAAELRREARRWTVMQRADMPLLGAANRQMQEDLALGARGISRFCRQVHPPLGNAVKAAIGPGLEHFLEATDTVLSILRSAPGHGASPFR